MICGKCKQDKPESEFHKGKRGRHAWCKACKKIYDANNNANNRARVRQNKRNSRERNRRFVLDYLMGKWCSACPEDNPIVLEFHHRGNKKENVGNAIQKGWSLKLLLQEIEKCTILCANCHRLETAKLNGSFKYVQTQRHKAASIAGEHKHWYWTLRNSFIKNRVKKYGKSVSNQTLDHLDKVLGKLWTWRVRFLNTFSVSQFQPTRVNGKLLWKG